MFGSILANLDEIEQERAVLEDQDSGAHVGTLVSGHLLILNIKVETSKVFLRDTSVISPYSLLLFGGSMVIQHQEGVVVIDGWLRLTAAAQTAVLFKQLRITLGAVLKELARKPEV